MYELKLIRVPKGYKINDYIKELYTNAKTAEEIDDCKDKIFRLTYKFGLDELKRNQHMTTIEDGLGDMSLAFLKTFKNFDPTKEGSSFLNYYKLAIKTEIINTKFRKYRNSAEGRELCYTMESATGYLDEPVEGKDGLDAGTKGDLISSKYDMFDEMVVNEWKDKLMNIALKVVKDNITYPKRLESHQKVISCWVDNLMGEEQSDAVYIGKLTDTEPHTARRIIHKYEEEIKRLWNEEYLKCKGDM